MNPAKIVFDENKPFSEKLSEIITLECTRRWAYLSPPDVMFLSTAIIGHKNPLKLKSCSSRHYTSSGLINGVENPKN